MFQFLKIKMYRQNFIAFVLSFLLACLILSSFLCNLLVHNQVEKEQSDANLAFNRLESAIELNKGKIDNHILYIYSSTELMNDFLIFFGSNAETYLTSRLDHVSPSRSAVSVLNDMQSFASGNQYSVKKIAFESLDTTNMICFSNNGSMNVKFRIPNEEVVLADSLRSGYVYTKKIYDPQNRGRPIGTIKFVIDFDKLAKQSLHAVSSYTAVMDSQRAVYDPGTAGSKIKAGISQAGLKRKNKSWTRGILFQKVYYDSYDSKTAGLSFFTAVDTMSIVNRNRGLFLMILFGTSALFLMMTFLVAARMYYDAKYLNSILISIDSAKTGNFTKIDTKMRRDEYGMIAQALNEMSDQLHHYIRTEYILKLKQKETEMKALQRQVNPHFLYNTLEIIRSCALMHQDLSVADAIFNLGNMFREIVKSGNVITFRQELEILTRYLKLMEFKFGDSFYYTIDFAPEMMEVNTVKFWLQPLCENFFVHGYDKDSRFNLMVVSSTVEEDGYLIQISNNGKEIPPEKLKEINRTVHLKEPDSCKSIGLQNVFARLNYYYGDVKMKISNNKEAGICLTIKIPRGKEPRDV